MRSLVAADSGPVSANGSTPEADEGAIDAFDSGSRWRNTCWAGLGFLCGAVFWHAVGFWAFLGGLMVRGPATEAAIEVNDCVTLVMVRETGTTRSEPCPMLIARLPEDRRNYRGPLLTAELKRLRMPASRWEVTINNDPSDDADPTDER